MMSKRIYLLNVWIMKMFYKRRKYENFMVKHAQAVFGAWAPRAQVSNLWVARVQRVEEEN